MTGDAIRTRLRARPIALPIRCDRPSPLPGVNHGRTRRFPTGTGRGGPAAALFAPVSRRARTRLVPSASRRVDLFTAMPVADAAAALGITVLPHEFAWTRARFGPPRLTRSTDLIGTSLVETGVVDPDRYLAAELVGV